MKPKSLIAFIGFVAIIAGVYCPILRPFGLFNWDVIDANKPYGIVILIVAIVGLASTIINQHKLVRATAWLSLVLIVLLLFAAIMKVNTSFSFIPFKGIARSLSKLIKFKWGWYVLFAGAILSVLGSLGKDRPSVAEQIRNGQKLA